ncbi:MAG: OadG family protein [Treponema sp.]|jgi:sodium pump decarboxylase gamma subunit|nr:OadG family protein [Treponema sp.]
MTIAEMLEQAVLLTVLGMTVVFAFLWFMIICVNLTAKLVHKMGWDKDVRPSPNVQNTSGAATPDIAAAITAAVTEYRKQGKERKKT